MDYYGSGVHTVLMGLLEGISEIDTNHEFILLSGPNQSFPESLDLRKFQIVSISPSTDTPIGKLFWDHVSVGIACKRLGIDVLYSPAHVRPAYAPGKVVVHVLDMMYHRFPEYWKWTDRAYFKFAVSALTSRATRIAALSESTKRDILSILSLGEDLIKVIYPGVPNGYGIVDPIESQKIREKYHIYDPYILFVGSSHPRKNLVRLIDAYEKVAKEIPQILVLKLSTHWNDKNVRRRIEESTLKNRIAIIQKTIPPSELACFYNEADLFVFPSLYEGFGLPVLEAFACGCPTVTSNVGSLPEVAGDAAILVPPNNTEAIRNSIFLVVSNPDLRSNLRERSLHQARKFSWSIAAQETLELLEEASLC
jgi:glycosyltransferase involved in cell wall biosynthesis